MLYFPIDVEPLPARWLLTDRDTVVPTVSAALIGSRKLCANAQTRDRLCRTLPISPERSLLDGAITTATALTLRARRAVWRHPKDIES